MGLYWQGIVHDLSKFSFVEFSNGVKYFTGDKSPHYREREDKGYSEAWLNHKNNKHHAEHWQDIRSDGKTHPIEIPTKYLAEMFADRIAASKTYLKENYFSGAPLEYYMSHKYENSYHESSRKKLEKWLTSLALKGEEEVLEEIKKELCR